MIKEGMPPAIEFRAFAVRGDFTLDVAFQASSGITALFGPSGSGKTTVLQLIAGLIAPQTGSISVGRRLLVDTSQRLQIPKYKRRIGLVFQDSQLFPHLTVAQNLNFGSWFAGDTKIVVPREKVISALGISHLLQRRVPRLSGGERQRVALARAVLASPDLLLLDEPLAQLDQARRLEILPLIEWLRDELNLPMLYVTHSAHEAIRLANRVVILADGRVTQVGDPARLLGESIGSGALQQQDASPCAADAARRL